MGSPGGCSGRFVGALRRWCGRMGAQEDGEDRADPGCALDLEESAMVVEDVLDDRQAEPGAAHLAGARRVDPVESFGQPGQVLARDSLAPVAHGYADHFILGAAAFPG